MDPRVPPPLPDVTVSCDGEPHRANDRARLVLPVVVVAALLGVAWHQGYFDLDDPERLSAAAHRADRIPWLAPIFVALFAMLAAAAVPISPLSYAAGALFGVVRGTVYVWIGALCGAAAGYYLARGMLAGPARRVFANHRDRLERLRERQSFLSVLRIQLVPVIPFGPINYAAGIARVSFRTFIAATAVGVLPGSLAAVYVGDRLMAGVRGDPGHPFLVAAAVAIGLIVVSFAPNLVRRWRPSA